VTYRKQTPVIEVKSGLHSNPAVPPTDLPLASKREKHGGEFSEPALEETFI